MHISVEVSAPIPNERHDEGNGSYQDTHHKYLNNSALLAIVDILINK